ncbi:MAG: DUF721 domain-containing protein [Actinobacteria bacterium]|nr:DUF721 domain-containing protein [Actinomycetota bacterium]
MIPERIGEHVRRELGRFGPQLGMAEIVAAWPSSVGEEIARNAWPARLARDGTLHVATSSSTWAFELTQLQHTVRDRLVAVAPEATVPRIVFAPGRLPEATGTDGTRAHREPLSVGPKELAAGRAIAAGVTSERLRDAVARAAAASLARAPYDRPV